MRQLTAELRAYPPLVFAGECELLKERLAFVASGEAFVLQDGDCAEFSDDVTADAVRHSLRTLLQMSALLTYAVSVPVLRINRIAGPAGSGSGPADPQRMVRTYQNSAATLNLMRAFTSGGYAGLDQVHAWNRDFAAHSPDAASYEALTTRIGRALDFMRACGTDPGEQLGTGEFFASHECAVPAYDAALTRTDSRTGKVYNTSGHFVWAGQAPGDLDDAQLGHLAGIDNPIGVRIGAGTGPDEALAHLDRLDPDRRPGRLTFIVRMDAGAMRYRLPALIEKVTAEGHQVAWICAPANRDEVSGFFEVHRALGTHPGGLQVSGLDNATSLDLAFQVAVQDPPLA